MSESRPHTLLLIENRGNRWYWELEAQNGKRVCRSMNNFSSMTAAHTNARNLLAVPYKYAVVRHEERET